MEKYNIKIDIKQDVRERIRFMCQGPVTGCSEKIRGISWLFERLMGCQK